jgi:hypothetical protein
VKIQPNADTDFVGRASVGSDGRTYAISYAGKLRENPIGGSIVVIAPNGATRVAFRQGSSEVLDFAAIPAELVILTKTHDQCPEVKWTSYQGKVLKTLPALCGASFLDASTPDNTIIGTSDGILLQRGDKFMRADFGNPVTWINSDELMYWEENTRCTWKYSLGQGSRTKVACGDWFGRAASPDGRYMTVRALTTEHWHDMPELRVLDTQTGRYIPVMRGALPTSFWAAKHR